MLNKIYSIFRINSHWHRNLLLCAVLISDSFNGWCEENKWFQPCASNGVLRFKSGFEESLQIIENDNGIYASIQGGATDNCSLDNKLLSKPLFKLGKVSIQFDGGAKSERGAEVVADPVNSDNRVLSFWILKPNVIGVNGSHAKGRVQMNVYDTIGLRHVKMSVRLYLHPDLKNLQYFPDKIDWLTLSEWWNNASWTQEKFPFRISLNLFKDASLTARPLNFKVHAQILNVESNRWNNVIWEKVNRDFSVPFGKWMLLEYEFIEGDKNHGKFTLNVTPEGGEKVTIFDVSNYTHHPDDSSPDGLKHFNPMKLYTNEHVINYIRHGMGRFKLFWDDFNLDAWAVSAD